MATQVELEDSNLANYGGEDHREAAKAAAETETEFEGAGKKPGLEIWRVENRRTESDTPDFGIKRWPEEDYGQFYDGDSYIVLNTYKAKDPETGKHTDKLAWDVHFWLGKDTSTDEKGVAAYKTVELDDLLDDGPVQHREVMGSESSLFQSYFKKSGIQYLSGGIESGFRKVEPVEYVPRLLKVRRTKRTTKATQVACNIASMNQGDVFILDLGEEVMQYVGPEASSFEKSSSANIISSLVGGRHGKTKEVPIDARFWETVGGEESAVPSAAAGDKEAEPSLDKSLVKVYKISDSTGDVKFSFVKPKRKEGYSTSVLQSDDVFVVDSGIEIFVWIGSGASKREKSQSWKLVDQYIKENNRPETLPVTVLNEGKVNIVFRSSFAVNRKWKGKDQKKKKK